MGPNWRRKVMLPSQTLCIFLLFVVLTGIIPHYMFPGSYRAYLWLLAGLNILVAVALYFRMAESPRWLEARERRDQARKVVERMEARAARTAASPCPSPTCGRMRWWLRRRPAGSRRSARST